MAKRTREGGTKMHSELEKALEFVRARRGFDVEWWINEKVTKFNNYLRDCGLKACVISCSGGVDSSCTLALVKRAMQQKDSPIEKIIGIAQPIHSTSTIQNRAFDQGKALDIEIITVDQTKIFDQLSNIVENAAGIVGQPFVQGQLKSYMRTPVQYYVTQLLSQSGLPAVVMGTGNYDEDGYLLYYCKAGDGVCDLQLLADIHKSEVFQVARACGVIDSILEAAPSADLWEGQTDEEELGMSYDFVELYTEYLKMNTMEQKV